MGYYTRHELSIISGGNELVDYESEINKLTDYSDCFDGEIKWYDREKNMREFSMQHPLVLFQIHGESEEPGDLWDEYYLNGKMQKCKGDIVYPPFDPSKLE